MIKTVKEVQKELVSAIRDSDERRILKEWGESIIDMCAGNFECTMEEDHVPGAENEYQRHPVLIRGTVLTVKKML